MTIFVVILLTLFQLSSASDVYNVAVLMLNDSQKIRFDIQRIGPAIDIAVETCLRDYDVVLQLIPEYYADKCSEVLSIGKATDIAYHNNITAFLGPACSDDLQVVGRFATYKEIPILTGLGDVLNKRKEFTTLIRMSYDLMDKAQAILAFLEHFGWKYAGLIFRERDVYYGTLAELFVGIARNKDFVITCQQTYLRDENKTILTDIREIMIKVKTCARVVVILGGDREVRKMMALASDLDMTQDGDYIFLYPELFQNEAKGNQSWSRGTNSLASKIAIKEAFESLLIVSISQPYSEQYLNFSDNVKERALKKYHFVYKESLVNYFTASFHDSVIALCRIIQQMILYGGNPWNGVQLSSSLRNISFNGMSGLVSINGEGDRVADYALLSQADKQNGNFEVALKYSGSTKTYEKIRPINWKGGKIPVDRPKCGFDGKDASCIRKRSRIIEISFAITCGLAVFLVAMGILTYRKVKLESALQNMSWRVKWDEISFSKDPRSSWMMNRLSITSAVSSKMDRGGVTWTPKFGDSIYLDACGGGTEYQNPFVLTGTYKGCTVAVKRIGRQKRIELTRDLRIELKKIREAQHQNIAAFIGACIDAPNISILMEYCPKGSLQDVLQNDSLELDWMFRYSLINDIVKGICYLHNGELGTHGRLRSTNCLVDSRFVLKLSDFGIPSLRSAETYSDKADIKEQTKSLWKAPELLRATHCTPVGTKKGDIYSFGIILQEIANREEPFYPFRDSMTIPDILKRVRSSESTPFRPIVPKDCCTKGMQKLMEKCWSEEPDERPDVGTIKAEMRMISRGQNGEVNIMDNLLSRMEQYANNLEYLVEQRTAAFLEEKRKSEELLYEVLPRSIAEQLKRGNAVDPEYYESVTIYFSDVVGFTNMCSSSTPIEVVDFLNDLYTCFDSTINDFDVYKVETIGDAYMVVSGLPERNGLRHAQQIALMAIALLNCVNSFKIRHKPEEKLKLRIGIHTGPCCAGVVGQKMPRYCLFGDTVNTASRMESTGEALKIHVSSSTKTILDHFDSFHLVPREEISVKGKGKMATYWLVDEKLANHKR